MIKKHNGFKKYFSLVYWKIQFARIITGNPPLNIIETFEFEIDESELRDGDKFEM